MLHVSQIARAAILSVEKQPQGNSQNGHRKNAFRRSFQEHSRCRHLATEKRLAAIRLASQTLPPTIHLIVHRIHGPNADVEYLLREPSYVFCNRGKMLLDKSHWHSERLEWLSHFCRAPLSLTDSLSNIRKGFDFHNRKVLRRRFSCIGGLGLRFSIA